MKFVNAEVVEFCPSTVAVSVTFNVLTPVSNLNVSLFGTLNVALNLP